MTRERDRDTAVEHLLRRLPEGTVPSPSDACAAPDVLAAWVEGALTADEVAALEAHAADCSHCQALLAVMARTGILEVPRPWWRPVFGVRWLVPLSAAAAMMTVWVMVRPADQSVRVPALDRAAETRSPQSALDSQPQSQAPAAAPAEQSGRPVGQTAAAERRKEEQSLARSDSAAKRSQLTLAQDKGRERKAVDAIAGRAEEMPARSSASGAVPPAPLPPGAPVPVAPAPAAALPAALPTVAAPQAPSPAPPAAGPEPARLAAGRGGGSSTQARALPAAGALAESVILQDSGSAAFAMRALREVVSPDPTFRWRLRAVDAVERSVDGGRTWESQQTGSPAVLTAGSSPAPAICWLVGRAGVVLRSTDGRTWQRVPFTEPADLLAVRATDGNTATVNTADGRAFSTTDGGLTWRNP